MPQTALGRIEGTYCMDFAEGPKGSCLLLWAPKPSCHPRELRGLSSFLWTWPELEDDAIVSARKTITPRQSALALNENFQREKGRRGREK